MRSDADIKREAEAQLKRPLPLSHALIGVRVDNGAATLEGAVQWSYQRVRAQSAVARLSCVVGVSSQITLSPKAPPHEIRAAVESAFRRRDALDSARSVKTPYSAGNRKDNVRSWAQR